MPTHLVNLDALIKREDFEASTEEQSKSQNITEELKLDDLARAYRNILRKPDFQRETSNWDTEKVVDFVRSFLDGDVIPSIIMWRSNSTGNVFVIDGSHRLSALMAWVHEDYGGGEISQQFWNHSIPPAQKKHADQTKAAIELQIGSYKLVKQVSEGTATARDAEMQRRAKNMDVFKIDIQWVNGNADKAEESFFRINGSPSVIDRTELDIIKARKKPNAIATRALMNAGSGHKYWHKFPKAMREKIEKLSDEIYNILFQPILSTPIKTTDLPIAGQGYSATAFRMVFDLVNMTNKISPAMWKEKKTKKEKADTSPQLQDDKDGSETVSFLKVVKRSADLISGDHKGSLGLHPMVYFYGPKFRPAALLAAVKFFVGLKTKDALIKFTKVRAAFEDFIVKHLRFVKALGHGYGGGMRPVDAIVEMYDVVFEEISSGNTDHPKIVGKLLEKERLHSIKAVMDKSEPKPVARKKLTTADKSAGFFRESIDSPVKCKICSARLHVKSISSDHVVRKQDGGRGGASNSQPTHPFCNHGYKEHLNSKSKKQATA